MDLLNRNFLRGVVLIYTLVFGIYTGFVISKGRADETVLTVAITTTLLPGVSYLIGRKIVWRLTAVCLFGVFLFWGLLPMTLHTVDRTVYFWLCWSGCGLLLGTMMVLSLLWKGEGSKKGMPT
jgi:hypothetical protein